MATVALIAVAVLALFVAILFAALVEMFRDLRQVREAIGILDRPLNIDIGPVAGTHPSQYGLPRALDSAGVALVLFLSERCATCHTLAAGLPRPLPAALWIVFEARSTASAATLLDRYGLTELSTHGRLIVDVGSEIAGRMGLHTTPVGYRVESGTIVFATTVPSLRYLTSILPETLRLRAAG